MVCGTIVVCYSICGTRVKDVVETEGALAFELCLLPHSLHTTFI